MLDLDYFLSLPDCSNKPPTEDYWIAQADYLDRKFLKINTHYLVERYIQSKDPKSVLILALHNHWVKELIDEIFHRADSYEFGKSILRDGNVKAFGKYITKKKLIPYESYYYMSDRPHVQEEIRKKGILDDRQVALENKAFDGFEWFIENKRRKAAELVQPEDIEKLFSTRFSDVPSDSGYQEAYNFVKNTFKIHVSIFYPNITGKLEAAQLGIKTHFKEYFQKYGTIKYKGVKGVKKPPLTEGKEEDYILKAKEKAGELWTVKRRVVVRHIPLDIEDETKDQLEAIARIAPEKAVSLGLRFDPQTIHAKRAENEEKYGNRHEAYEMVREKYPEYFDALMMQANKGGNINKTLITKQMKRSRPYVDKLSKKVAKEVREIIGLSPGRKFYT